MVSMTSNKTSLEAAAVDAGTTKRAEAGRTVMDGDRAGGSCDPGCVEVEVSCRVQRTSYDATATAARTTRGAKDGLVLVSCYFCGRG